MLSKGTFNYAVLHNLTLTCFNATGDATTATSDNNNEFDNGFGDDDDTNSGHYDEAGVGDDAMYDNDEDAEDDI